MVSVIQNQTVEKRGDPMAGRNSSEKGGNDSSLNAAGPSVTSYRSSADAELRRYSRNLDVYARSLDHIAAEAGRAGRPSESLYTKSRNRDARTVHKLLKEWEEDRLNNTAGAVPVRTRRTLYGSVNNFAQEEPRRRGRPVHHQAYDGVRRFLGQTQQLPVVAAAILAVVVLSSTIFVPGTLVTGMMANNAIAMPASNDIDQVLYDFIRPMSEDNVSVDLSTIDTKKFDMLTTRNYVSQPGDTIYKLSKRTGLHPDTIISFNGLSNPRYLPPGKTYVIPNRDGLLYTVRANDSLQGVATRFGVSVVSLLDGNNLSDEHLVAGTKLFIPDARMNPTDLKLLLGELFAWPAIGRMSSFFGYRTDPFTGMNMFHNGIDLAGYIGAPVRAALEGKVVDIESQVGNYGKMIIIQHPRGIKTLYGHLSAFNVEVGQYVSQGQLIARMGNTGRSTGPHLHFSVILNGTFVNPLRYLK